MTLTWLDLMIIAIPFAVVIGVSVILRSYVRSVADFLAAGRCAGRYLICTANAELMAGPTNMVANLEVFSQIGFSVYLWSSFEIVIMIILALNGVVSYRFRETRSLTFHQFFEARYSKGVRMLASFLNFISGALSFAIQPAIGARFIVYFCNLPPTIKVGSLHVETIGILMVILLSVALFMTMTGGQISVILTDCLEGLMAGIFYILVAVSILWVVSNSRMQHVLISGPPGQSLVNPLDISKSPKFDYSYVIMVFAMRLFAYRGNASQAGFAASARSPHEGKMSGILTTWRGIGSGLMTTLMAVGALTVLHHAAYADKAAIVAQRVAGLSDTLKTEMRMPVALSLLLPMGAKGAVCACMLFGMLAGLGGQMHAYGTGFVQDVVIPLRKTPLKPKHQILLLRASVVGMGIFGIVFGLFYSMPDMVIFVLQLMGGIYLCIGAVVWGGLYWKKGTNAGAWASLSVGATIAILSLIITSSWQSHLAAWCISMAHHLGWQRAAHYLSQNTKKFPVRLQVLTCISYAGAGISYVVVSLLTCRQPYNLDQLLHRGKYRVEGMGLQAPARRSKIKQFLGFNHDYTQTDKFIAIFALCWTLTWNFGFITILLWNLLVHRWGDTSWFRWSFFKEVWAALAVGLFTTTWFTTGGVRDIISLFRTLKTLKRDDSDNGMVMAQQPANTSDAMLIAVEHEVTEIKDETTAIQNK